MLLLAAVAAALTLHAPLDDSPRATAPSGRVIEPNVSREVSFADRRAIIGPGGELSYSVAAATVLPSLSQGTVSFWWKPPASAAGPSSASAILALAHRERVDNFLVIANTQAGLELTVRDRDLRDHSATAADTAALREEPARWRHITITWTELSGAALFIDGHRTRAVIAGPLYFNARPGDLRLFAGEWDELNIFTGALTIAGVAALARREIPRDLPALSPPPPLAERMGWHAAANIPVGMRFRVKRWAVTEARAMNRFCWRLTDGRDETAWPSPEPEGRYRDEGGDFSITPAPGSVINAIRSTGNAQATIESHPRVGPQYLHYARPFSGRQSEEVHVAVQSGALSEVSLLNLQRVAELPAPENVVPIPGAKETAVRGVRVSIAVTRAIYYRLAVADPLDDTRHVIEFDFRANAAGPAAVELEFPPLMLLPGKTMRIEVWCSETAQEVVQPSAVTWLGAADAKAALASHIEQRRLDLQNLYQQETASGERPEPATRLAEDLLHWQPDDPLALRLAGREPPLASWSEPVPPEGVPRWAWQQVAILKHLKAFGDWWIDYRQANTGEFGNGPEGDAELLRLWPGLAWLDGRVDRYRQSARKLFDWLGKEDRAIASAAAIALDSGNPVLAAVAPHAAPPPEAIVSPTVEVEAQQAKLWGYLEKNIMFLTRLEPMLVDLDISPLLSIRLGPGRPVTWENTGGELAARVDESTPKHLSIQLFTTSSFARRIRLHAWRLDHGNYRLTLKSGEHLLDSRQVVVKPETAIDLDLPSKQLTRLELRQESGRTPVDRLPDLAIAREEVSRQPKGTLILTVHNLGAVEAGPSIVSVHAPDSEDLLGEVAVPAIPPNRGVPVPLAGYDPKPGLRFRVRLAAEAADEARDSNNEAVLTPADARRLAQLLRP